MSTRLGWRCAYSARACPGPRAGTSDLDLALMTNEPLDIGRMTALKAAFTESNLPFRVDIVDWASTSESFRKVIERGAALSCMSGNKRQTCGGERVVFNEPRRAMRFPIRFRLYTTHFKGAPLVTILSLKVSRVMNALTACRNPVIQDANNWVSKGDFSDKTECGL